ncbi:MULTISPECIES: flavohemoglobin expression-modulating QEGLA motif protein [Pseudoalteromonas]|uniref:flavohemoglobin expression-modulating QEGLA motif protein n=1 Tax=Pseudoalteromonas TaxID=53246 RepID=UPI001571A587|nr:MULTISPECIES: flavohemoglobin expression-modulating QEGLA motif protein [Pseudoalteromonas]MBR8843971.1 flavohemoglobin expression-modulating QEGLA motif protein [Pseudoalteromonas sp. JC3]UDM60828.1 flavohemoglobin expression-modulating QEGLA motif protein [Pseudoalteromonas piscicida]WJE08031.1 flavohemoglobin expression-modulating QEGLA motif protein [Pseudoalteromonas sp. JC3]
MLMLSEQAIIAALEAGKPISGQFAEGAFHLEVREYVPYVATAVHAGHRTRASLKGLFAISDAERLQEEDPFTDGMIESLPITLIARDSRYEYDLNRAPELAIYKEAWGKQVWSQALPNADIDVSLSKHAAYYRVLSALLTTLERKFGACLLFDVHSYNYQIRSYPYAPTFNIGTAQLDTLRFRAVLDELKKQLGLKKLAGQLVDCAENTVFQGHGYQAQYITSHFDNTLVVPLEVKKVFMDENSGELFPVVFEKLQRNMHVALSKTAKTFAKNHCYKPLRKAKSTSQLDPALINVDSALYRIARNLETLHYVNPSNIAQEKRRFFSKRHYQPAFKYRPLKIDPYEFKEQLYRLPVGKIQDPIVKDLYRKVIDSYATKIELITQIGREAFLYNSLRYYGEPDYNDINNATFLLHARETETLPKKDITAEQALVRFNQAIEAMGLPCKVAISSKLVAKAMVDNSKRLLLVNSSAMLSELDINALIEHEIGVHLLTTLNADAQQLKVLHLGLPGNTYTQEGLAIYREYQSGQINLTRLKVLALRVIAVNMLLKGDKFYQVYEFLADSGVLNVNEAFALTTRIFRGGGFTKDHLYLKGFKDIVQLANTRSLDNLYLGKTGIAHLDALDALVEQGIFTRPKYLPDTSRDPEPDAILSYLISSIK